MKARAASYLLWLYAVLSVYVSFGPLAGLPYTPAFTPLLTLIAFSFALLHAAQRLEWRRALLFLILAFGVSLLFECVGVTTGLVYGPYHYTDQLGVKFLGLVPLLVPMAWFMMMYPSYVIATRLVPSNWNKWQWRLGVAALGGVIMTAWDLALDPLMVSAGHWVWEINGAYYGVPLQNYWGWWLTTFVIFILFLLSSRTGPVGAGQAVLSFDRLAVISYAISGLSFCIWDLTRGLDGPGMVGLFAMLPWIWSAFANRRLAQQVPLPSGGPLAPEP